MSTPARDPKVAAYSGTALCGEYAAEIVAYFYQQIDIGRMQENARTHLRRTAEYAVCYAHEVSNASSNVWWERFGRAYWQMRAQKLASALGTTDPISGKFLQEKINEQIAAYNRGRQHALDQHANGDESALRSFVTNEIGSESGHHTDVAQLLEILAGCPFGEGMVQTSSLLEG